MGGVFASIRFRLIGGFALIALGLIGNGLYFGRFVDRQQLGLERLLQEQQAFFVLNRVGNSFVAFQVALLGKDSTPAQVAAAQDEFHGRLEAFAQHNPEVSREVRRQADLYAGHATRIREAGRRGDSTAIAAATVEARAAAIELGKVLRGGFDALDQSYKSLLQQELASQRRWERAFHAGVFAALAMLLFYVALLLRDIVRPLGATVSGIRALRQGTVLPALPTNGEFGQISQVLDELCDATQTIRDMAYFDAPTGLVSRARFEHAVAEAAQRSQARQQPLCVVLVELQQMREIVAAYGPAIGARALRVAAERIGSASSHALPPARYADARFGLLLPDTGLAEAQRRARDWLAMLKIPLMLDGLSLRLQAVAGIAVMPDDGADAGPLLAAAETALVSAAAGPSGTVASFDRALAESFRRDFSLLQDLERGLGQGELVPFYEPIVDCARGCVIGAEALIRWRHPLRGLLKPIDFLPIAERGGQIAAVDACAIEQAIPQLARWQADGHALRLGLNLSPRHLSAATLERLEEALRTSGVHASDLVAELTETTIIASGGEADRVIRELHALGMKICLDDFGTGYSSFSYVRRLPIERLKVDRSFVSEVGHSSAAERIIEATLSLARSIDITVIAEGVETPEQMHWLMQRGCVHQQGWLYAQAQPAARFEEWLRQAPAQLNQLLRKAA